jgi:hypothetical protein
MAELTGMTVKYEGGSHRYQSLLYSILSERVRLHPSPR